MYRELVVVIILCLITFMYTYISVLTFGFSFALLNAIESAGSVTLSVHFSGNAGEFVPYINVSAVGGTATGEYYTFVSAYSSSSYTDL